jgi:diguanylate cyclase (GGDEF)-like protein/PAS domain S-box-containing protein
MQESLSRNLDFLHTLLDAMPSMLFVVDSDVRIMHVNAAASKLIGGDISAVLMHRGGGVLHCIHAGETPEGCGRSASCKSCVIRNSVTEAIKGKQVFRAPTKMDLVTQDGIKEVHYQITATPFAYGSNNFALLAIEDASELKEAEKAVRASEARLRNITAMLGEGVYALDVQGGLTFLNPEAERLLGWTEAELLGKGVHSVIHFQKADKTPLAAEDCPVHKAFMLGKTHRDDEDVFTRKDGTMFPVSIVATPLWEQGRIVGAVAAFQDITERQQAAGELNRLNELLARQAKTDALTGIGNRLKFNETLNAEVHRSRRHGLTFSLIMLDIDHFKGINDTCGHNAGDGVLRQIAGLIASNVRVHDLFARWGGEEFMILVTNASLENARAFAEKLRRLIEHHDFPGIGRVTSSFGVAEFDSSETEDVLMQRVDRALYRAKELGRNRVEAEGK